MTDTPRYWEPFTIKVGDQVKVLARPECRYCEASSDEEIGLTGIVLDDDFFGTHFPDEDFSDSTIGAEAHHLWVQLDSGDTSHFAAAELELIESVS